MLIFCMDGLVQDCSISNANVIGIMSLLKETLLFVELHSQNDGNILNFYDYYSVSILITVTS